MLAKETRVVGVTDGLQISEEKSAEALKHYRGNLWTSVGSGELTYFPQGHAIQASRASRIKDMGDFSSGSQRGNTVRRRGPGSRDSPQDQVGCGVDFYRRPV